MNNKKAVGVGVLWVLWSFLGGPTWAQEQPRACEDQRAVLSVHLQIVQNSRAQVEGELSRLAIEADKLRTENARLKAEVAKAKISGQTAPQQ